MAFSLESYPDTPASLKAQQRGLLVSKEKALKSVERLQRIGEPLSILVLVTSMFHMFRVLSGLELNHYVHWFATALLVGAIDGLAFFTVAANIAARDTNQKQSLIGEWGVLSLIGFLNAASLLQDITTLPSWSRELLPYVSAGFTILLVCFQPVAYRTVHNALHTLQISQLNLLSDIERLHALIADELTTIVTIAPEPAAPQLTDHPVPAALPVPSEDVVLENLLTTPTTEEVLVTVEAPVAAVVMSDEEAQKTEATLKVYRECRNKNTAIFEVWGVRKSGSGRTYKRALELLNARLATA